MHYQDWKLCCAIGDRAAALFGPSSPLHRRAALLGALVYVVHHDVHPLRLADMLGGPDVHLLHDVAGIAAHADLTGRAYLRGGFKPRYAVATVAECKVCGCMTDGVDLCSDCQAANELEHVEAMQDELEAADAEVCPGCGAVEGTEAWGTVGDGFDGYCPS